MNTTREDHDITCLTCAEVIQPCPDDRCICRYNHGDGLCPTCTDQEIGQDLRET